jgi:hypothetical protein
MTKELEFTRLTEGLPTTRPYGVFTIDGKQVVMAILSLAGATHFLNKLKTEVPAFADIDVATYEEQVRAAGLPDTIAGAELILATTGRPAVELPPGVTFGNAETWAIDTRFDHQMQSVGAIPKRVEFKACLNGCLGGAPHGYLYIGPKRIKVVVRSVVQGTRLFEIVKEDPLYANDMAVVEFVGAVETSLKSFGLPETIMSADDDRQEAEMEYFMGASGGLDLGALIAAAGGERGIDAMLGARERRPDLGRRERRPRR